MACSSSVASGLASLRPQSSARPGLYKLGCEARGQPGPAGVAAYFGGGVVLPLLFFPFLPPLWPFLPPLCLFLPLELVLATPAELMSPPAGCVTDSAVNVLTDEPPDATPGAAAVDPSSATSTYSRNAMLAPC